LEGEGVEWEVPMKMNVFLTDIASIALEAYAEDGLLSIKDTSEWKIPVAYRRRQSADHSDTLITLSGGGVADETLIWNGY